MPCLPRGPDLRRLTQSLLVNQSVEGHIDNSNGVVDERRICCLDRQVESIGVQEAQAENGNCSPKSHFCP